MKKSLSLALFALAASLAPAHAATVGLSASPIVADSFDVAVNLTDVFAPPHDFDGFVAFGFNITYDSTFLSFLGETAGPYFTDISGQPGLDAQVAGFVTNVFLSAGDFTEPLQLAVLHFGLAGTGNYGPTTIGVTGDPSTSFDQGLFYLTSENADPISASTSLSAVPEPGTLLLGALGALALGAARFKR